VSLMSGAIPAPVVARQAPGQGLVQRCGGVNCPPGTCYHTDDPADAVHRSADDDMAGGPVPDAVLRILDMPGQSLEASTLTAMEARLGHDFGRVRVHTDDEAARSARDIHASAYTFGQHVVMGAGSYQPHTPSGSCLLAHELAHVVQQPASAGPLERPTTISHPHDQSEREADEIAGRTAGNAAMPESHDSDWLRGGPVSAQTVARQPATSARPAMAPLVWLDCGAMLIEFDTDLGSESYRLDSCQIRPGNYVARVNVTGRDLQLDFGNQVGGDVFGFSYSVGPGQRDPSQLFRQNGISANVTVAATAPGIEPSEDISESMPGDDVFEREFASGAPAPYTGLAPSGSTAAWSTLSSQPGSPLASFVTPGARYAVALTPGFPAGGYTPPAGLLATEALAGDVAAAQAAGTAETLLAAQGLTTTTTAVAEGTALAEGLTAAGEGILVFEAAGGAEAEAAIPVAGWIVGAIVLVAAGGLLLAGYLLRRSQQQATQAAPQVATDSKTGDCTEEHHEALQSAVDRHCKELPRSCRPGMGKAQLKRMAFRNWRCARARDQMNEECFKGGDPGHKRAAQLAWDAYQRCWDLYHEADRSR
jgi:Domain of unknown function (DUF4157)/Novel toxin 16